MELSKTIQSVRPDDPLMSIPQHTLLYRARRGMQVALAVADVLPARPISKACNRAMRRAAAGEDAAHFKELLSASAYIAPSPSPPISVQLIDSEGEPPEDIKEPDFLFDTPQDALKWLISALDKTIAGAPDDADSDRRARTFARVAIDGLMTRKARFTGLAASRMSISASMPTISP